MIQSSFSPFPGAIFLPDFSIHPEGTALGPAPPPTSHPESSEGRRWSSFLQSIPDSSHTDPGEELSIPTGGLRNPCSEAQVPLSVPPLGPSPPSSLGHGFLSYICSHEEKDKSHSS